MAIKIPQNPSAVPDAGGNIQPVQPGSRNPVTDSDPTAISESQSSKRSSRISSAGKAHFRLGLAVSGALALAAALFLRRKRRGQPSSPFEDPDVEDFTANQRAMLSRVREIWEEHCAGAEPETGSPDWTGVAHVPNGNL